MPIPAIETARLNLVLQSPDELRASIATMPPEVKAELSPAWLAQVENATAADPWIHGFTMIEKESGNPVGQCGFKGPPARGVAEIAYGVNPDRQGRGYATEAAAALTAFAFADSRVTHVGAHTLPEINASTQVLAKCDFKHIGEVIDPEDGLVWRWEKSRFTPSQE